LGVGLVVDFDVLPEPEHTLAQPREIRNLHFVVLAAHEVDQVLVIRIAQVVCHRRGREAHEVARGHAERSHRHEREHPADLLRVSRKPGAGPLPTLEHEPPLETVVLDGDEARRMCPVLEERSLGQ
jgi:hypothetical protein